MYSPFFIFICHLTTFRLRNPFKHNARVQTTAFPFIRAEFANTTFVRWGWKSPSLVYFLVGKISKSDQVLKRSLLCPRVGVNCIPYIN